MDQPSWPSAYAVLASFLFLPYLASAQVIPPERSTDWSRAGFYMEIPDPTQVLNISTYGAIGDGVTPTSVALGQAFTDAQGQMTIIQFPAGDFLFTQAIVLPDSVVIRGEGAGATNLLFDLGGAGHCILAVGQELSATYPFETDAERGSTSVQLTGAPELMPGDLIRLYRDDQDLVVSPWALGTTGQLVHVLEASTTGDVTLVSPLRAHYTIEGAAYARRVIPRMFSGVECLRIERMDETVEQWSNIWFSKASHCWVRGVESDMANFSHIELFESTNCEINGNYLHHAFSYGSGGKAYGVNLMHTAGENLIENNIFEHLRHSMMVQIGSNGNVLAYNYSTDPFWQQGGLPANSAGDLVLHGDHPYLNLFESNIVQNIVIDDSHGKNGPFNTLFRNRASTWGVLMSNGPATDSMNFVGNDISGNFFVVSGTGHFLYGNDYQGALIPEGTADLLDATYYIGDLPSFLLPINGLPQIGPNALPPGTIPAEMRFLGGGVLTVCPGDIITGIPSVPSGGMKVMPNPFFDRIVIERMGVDAGPVVVELYDLTGKIVHRELSTSLDRITIEGLGDLRSGVYLIAVKSVGGAIFRTVVVKE